MFTHGHLYNVKSSLTHLIYTAAEKDVDAFHPENVGKIMIGDFDFLPCTPAGVMEMLKYCDIDVCGKECVVIGRSNIVGKPMSMLLLHKNATVTIFAFYMIIVFIKCLEVVHH